MNDLFRPESVESATRRLVGDVVLAIPLPLRIYGMIAAGVVCVALIFLTVASYGRQEEVIGWLVTRGGIIRVATHSGGTVERLMVKEGDFVREGQPLAEIRSSTAMNAGVDAGDAATAALAAEARALQDQTNAAHSKLLAEQASLNRRTAQLSAQIAEGKRQISVQHEQIAIAQLDYERFQRIFAEHAISEREVQARKSVLLGAQQTLSQLRTTVLGYEQELTEARLRQQSIPSDLAAAGAVGRASGAQIEQKRIQTRTQGRDLVLASIAGRIQALPLDLGQSVPAGATVAVITPKNARLEAELYAPSRVIGFVRPGQPVHLMYQAFPHEKFGTRSATVTTISRTILSPTELSLPGLAVQQPVFRIRAAIDEQGIHAYGQYVPLQPGMLLSATIIFDRRSLIEWLFDPIYAARK